MPFIHLGFQYESDRQSVNNCYHMSKYSNTAKMQRIFKRPTKLSGSNQQVTILDDPEKDGIRHRRSRMARTKDFCHLSAKYFREICNTGSMHGINHFVAPNRHYVET